MASPPSTVLATTAEEPDVSGLGKALEKTTIEEAKLSDDLLGTPEAIKKLMNLLVDLPTSPPSLYVDIEGIELGRKGSVSILQLLLLPLNETFLIDIHTLGKEAFSTPGDSGQTFKSILEDPTIPKVFFDIRNDSDALFCHYGISVSCIQDLQLMELATRTYPRRFVCGLAKCIKYDLSLSVRQEREWQDVKEKGRKKFAPEKGGSYGVFNERPLPEDMRVYCVQDVQFMPKLWALYDRKLSSSWRLKVEKATRDRIAESKSSYFQGKGRHMAEKPKGW